jgi:hypothetical protein
MRQAFFLSILIALPGLLPAQTKIAGNPNITRTVFEDQPATLLLAPHVTTTIRLPDPVNSVIVGDSNLFQAEHSPTEPLLVFVKPVTSTVAQSNLLISTARGRQFLLLLRSLGPSADESESGVDLFVICRAASVFFIDETFPAAVLSETVNLGTAALRESRRDGNDLTSQSEEGLGLDEIVSRQRNQAIEKLYGNRIRVGIGQVTEHGSRLTVSFSVINSKSEAIELVPPQVQLAGQSNAGIFRRTRQTTIQQLPVEAYQISQRRLNRGDRVDGVVIFERPPIKQSTEGLMLQIADSAAIDQPTLAPINFRETKPVGKNHE